MTSRSCRDKFGARFRGWDRKKVLKALKAARSIASPDGDAYDIWWDAGNLLCSWGRNHHDKQDGQDLLILGIQLRQAAIRSMTSVD